VSAGVELTEAERLVYAAAFALAIHRTEEPVIAACRAVMILRNNAALAQADDFNPEALAMLRAFRGGR